MEEACREACARQPLIDASLRLTIVKVASKLQKAKDRKWLARVPQVLRDSNVTLPAGVTGRDVSDCAGMLLCVDLNFLHLQSQPH